MITLFEAQRRLKHRTDIIVDWGSYTKASGKVRVTCNKCDYKWGVIYHSLLRGRGCPRCAGNLKLTLQEAQQRLKDRTDITVDWDSYTKASGKIRVTCNKCHHTWRAIFKNL